MGKHTDATKEVRGAQRGTSLTLSSCGGKPEDTAQDQIEEVTL